jgi:hypothetical protein
MGASSAIAFSNHRRSAGLRRLIAAMTAQGHLASDKQKRVQYVIDSTGVWVANSNLIRGTTAERRDDEPAGA